MADTNIECLKASTKRLIIESVIDETIQSAQRNAHRTEQIIEENVDPQQRELWESALDVFESQILRLNHLKRDVLEIPECTTYIDFEHMWDEDIKKLYDSLPRGSESREQMHPIMRERYLSID